jgi:Cu2+-containing amine oxidase
MQSSNQHASPYNPLATHLSTTFAGEIHYFDADSMTFEGKAYTKSNAICLHEEDYGVQVCCMPLL